MIVPALRAFNPAQRRSQFESTEFSPSVTPAIDAHRTERARVLGAYDLNSSLCIDRPRDERVSRVLSFVHNLSKIVTIAGRPCAESRPLQNACRPTAESQQAGVVGFGWGRNSIPSEWCVRRQPSPECNIRPSSPHTHHISASRTRRQYHATFISTGSSRPKRVLSWTFRGEWLSVCRAITPNLFRFALSYSRQLSTAHKLQTKQSALDAHNTSDISAKQRLYSEKPQHSAPPTISRGPPLVRQL